MNESRIARAERRHAEATARRNDARARHGNTAGELADAETAWRAARLETMSLDDFARLGAQVELLRREVAAAQADLKAAEQPLRHAQHELADVRQSLFAARDRLDHAQRHGNAAEERAARAQLATLAGEWGYAGL